MKFEIPNNHEAYHPLILNDPDLDQVKELKNDISQLRPLEEFGPKDHTISGFITFVCVIIFLLLVNVWRRCYGCQIPQCCQTIPKNKVLPKDEVQLQQVPQVRHMVETRKKSSSCYKI